MEGPALHIDFETRSVVDLTKSGVFRYAEHPTTMPWGFSYWMEGTQLVKRWWPGGPDPVDALEHIRRGERVVAHNAVFERTIWNNIVVKRLRPHWPRISIRQQDCTMARAAAISHPQRLEDLGPALHARQSKDMAGNALMKKMMRPRKYLPDGTILWWDELENVTRLAEYCDQDVRTEAEVDKMLPPLAPSEYETWVLDQTINERGVYVNRQRIEALTHLRDIAVKEADATMRQLTARAVPRVTNVGKLVSWLQTQGIPCDGMTKRDQDDLAFWADVKGNQNAADAIELRKNTAKTSTKKYQAMLDCVSADGRMRGLLNYHGANTGRWSGRLVQPHNYPRLDEDEDIDRVRYLNRLLDLGWEPKELFEGLTALYGNLEPLRLLSLALRSTVEAEPGNELIGGDFSNIEGRVNGWLHDELWKLDAFRAYDTILPDGKRGGPDMYRLTYAKSFGVADPNKVTKKQRQVGKVQELFLGYQGGVGAFFGPTVKMSPYDISDTVLAATSAEQWDNTAMLYHVPGTARFDMPEKEWTSLKVTVDNWRASNSSIVQGWWDLQDAAIQAVSQPGTIVPVCRGRVQYYYDGKTLWCVLPSGRMLAYNSPSIRTSTEIRVGRDGQPYERVKYTVYFWGTDPKTKQWSERNLYGGLQDENIVQATARDVMLGAMWRCERAGYPIILTVHDDILTEPSTDMIEMLGLSAEHFASIMGQGEPWTEGLPIAVDAYRDHRWAH